MRVQGARVGVGELVAAHRALEAVDCSSREDSRLALRAVLCSQRADIERFEAAFDAVFGPASSDVDRGDPLAELGAVARAALPHAAIPASGPPRSEVDERDAIPAAWSDVELLRHKDFAQYSDTEMAVARELIARLARRGPTRLSRRTRPVRRRRGHEPDLRRVLRASLRTGGEPVHRVWRAPSRRGRPVV